jgi:hypothetical protein
MKDVDVHYDDDSVRRFFLAGSVVLMAVAAAPVTRAQAAEIYLCADGRNLHVTSENRERLSADACIADWVKASQAAKADKPATVAAADETPAKVETQPIMKKTAMRAVFVEPEPRAAKRPLGASPVRGTSRNPLLAEMATTPNGKPARRSARVERTSDGLKSMGDGLFAR